MEPASREAFRLFHEGAIALSEMECEGIPICLERLNESEVSIKQEIRELESRLRGHQVYELQRERFGKDTNVNSRDQLSKVIYDDLGVAGSKKSDNGKYVFDDQTLAELVADPSIQEYLETYREVQKLYKLQGTYIEGLRRETVNGRIHGLLNLHLVGTYRGSADSPNLNNLPTRNKKVSKHIKGAIVPRKGFCLVEIDYSALEVHIATCYHKDPTMKAYLESGYDMHSDMAAECYLLNQEFRDKYPKEFKAMRQDTKSYFTFAAFYGDYHASIAANLWKAAGNHKLLKHLARQGYTQLGVQDDNGRKVCNYGKDCYVTYVKEVERRFWKERFPIYDQWKRDWWDGYCRKGFFHTLTGFRVRGVYKKNEVVNSPVQGSAFHCLLQAIIDVQKEIKARNMQSRVILEIHDSMIAEVKLEELDDFVDMATGIMTTKLREKWPWIILPLKVEVEVGYDSWYAKEAYKPK